MALFFFLEVSCLRILYIYVFFSVLHQEGPISKASRYSAVEMGDGKESELLTLGRFLVPCRIPGLHNFVVCNPIPRLKSNLFI